MAEDESGSGFRRLRIQAEPRVISTDEDMKRLALEILLRSETVWECREHEVYVSNKVGMGRAQDLANEMIKSREIVLATHYTMIDLMRRLGDESESTHILGCPFCGYGRRVR